MNALVTLIAPSWKVVVVERVIPPTSKSFCRRMVSVAVEPRGRTTCRGADGVMVPMPTCPVPNFTISSAGVVFWVSSRMNE